MTATPGDVQAKLAAAKTALSKTTTTYPAMVRKYGTDVSKWPAKAQWTIALTNIDSASTEAGDLVAPAAPVANFAFKEA